MNPILSMFGNSAPVSGITILFQAIGAAMRGEKAQTFMKQLANSHPQLKKMNLDDLYGTAQQMCNERGLKEEDVAKSIDSIIASKTN